MMRCQSDMSRGECISRRFKGFLVAVILMLLTGCVAGQASFVKGNQALDAQDFDQAVVEYLAAVESDPGNHEYRLKLNQARNRAATIHKEKADQFFSQTKYLEALQEYRFAAELDGSMFAAFEGLRRAQDRIQAEKYVKEAEHLLSASQRGQAGEILTQALTLIPDYQPALQLKEKIRQGQYALVDGVELDVTSMELIDLNFRETKIPDVFDILTKLSGINFILDEDVRNNKTTLFLEQATFAQALELLLRMNKLDKKILNSKTIILFPKTRDKQKQFEDQIIQTFYLSHIDAKKAVNMLRTMLQVRKIYVQEELNAIVIRDQPDVVKLAQKLIEANDRGSSEVVFDLELIEVNHSDTRDLGLKLSNYSIGGGLSLPGSGKIVDTGLSAGGPTTNLIDFSKGLDPFYSIPTASFRFMKTLVDAEVLANPKIRVRNKEKAKVHVGSREPIVTVTINDTQTSENVQYIDVGVKLNVEPIIQLDNTIVTKLGLEVSNVSGREKTANGTAVITISSTNADTTLTLKDGEQTIIGGLIRDDNAVTKSKIPLLGDIPVLGEVFNGTDTTKTKREILLSITPHIVKSVHVPQGDTASIWSGGEDDLKFGRNFGTFADEYKAGQQGLEPLVEEQSEPQVEEQLEPQVEKEAETDSVEVLPQSSLSLEMENQDPVTEVVVTEAPPKSLLLVDGKKIIKTGELFDLMFSITNVQALANATVQIDYDPQILDFQNIEKGMFIGGQNDATFAYDVMNDDGRIRVMFGAGSNASSLSGQGELFTLSFMAIAEGRTEVWPSEQTFTDVDNENLAIESFGLDIQIVP